MKNKGHVRGVQGARLLVCLFGLLSAVLGGCAVLAQAPTTKPAGAVEASNPVAVANLRGTMTLDGPWKFQEGDDPRWSQLDYNEAGWTTVSLSSSLNEQGIDAYYGYAWYRMRIPSEQLAAFGNAPLALLLTPNFVGQLDVYVNNVEVARTGGFAEHPSELLEPPLMVQLPAGKGPIELAVRTWAGPGTPIKRGLLAKAELGTADEVAEKLNMSAGRRWSEQVGAALVLTLLFLGMAVLGLSLYASQRHHSEYLWLALMCLAVAAQGASDAVFGLSRLPLGAYRMFGLFSGRVFMAVTLEFVLRFTSSSSRRVIRGVQIAVLLLPFVYLIQLVQLYQALSVAAEVVFCALVVVLLFRAWRKGNGEAGVMLLPFLLAALGGSLASIMDYAGSKHWLSAKVASPSFHIGPVAYGISTVAYTIFLFSLLTVVLYRFVRVSEEEQRSAAEIAAARSVQNLLIPTQLPSTRNFMLESAYLPVNGVGGDFFQVLPLKDDSLLIVVGDVSGKGLQAAMNSSTLVGALRNELSFDPATVLEHLNRVLLGAAPSESGKKQDSEAAPTFATCLCARIYPDGTITIANAGHLNPYRDGREMQLTPSLPLGVIAQAEYEQTTFRLDRGDRLVFLSDGVVEATNSQGELFGFERTQQVANESARYIAQTAQRFGQTDDITVLSLYVTSKAAERHAEELARMN